MTELRRIQQIEFGPALGGVLDLPPTASGVVVFADGGSRYSPHANRIAEALRRAGIGTLFLEHRGDATGEAAVALLSDGLQVAAFTLRAALDRPDLPIGYFGAGAGAQAAMRAATAPDADVTALALRSDEAEPTSDTPTLLLRGGKDEPQHTAHWFVEHFR